MTQSLTGRDWQASCSGKVDAGLVQCAVVSEDKRKLIVPESRFWRIATLSS